jgi:hypothetical protein
MRLSPWSIILVLGLSLVPMGSSGTKRGGFLISRDMSASRVNSPSIYLSQDEGSSSVNSTVQSNQPKISLCVEKLFGRMYQLPRCRA